MSESAQAVREHARNLWHAASPKRRAQGTGWYAMAEGFATALARETGHSVAHSAQVIAVTSVNQSWKGNQTLATKHLKEGWMGGLPAVREQLRTGVISGRKVTNFAKAIAGDKRAVVVDRWMFRTFGMANSDGAYSAIESGITDAADDLGISPRTLQATIWCIMRGKAE